MKTASINKTQNQIDNMTLLQRAAAPTPKLFKTLKTIGLTLAAVSGGLLAAPVTLPAVIVTIAGYLGLAGGILSAVSQITVETNGPVIS